jgi:hypothetical protein
MDKQTLDGIAVRLKEVSGVVETLDPSIRGQAFDLLRAYVIGDAGAPRPGVKEAANEVRYEGLADLIGANHKEKPADNAFLLAANHYAQSGTEPFSTKEIEEAAADAGLIIPERVDKTFVSARRDGNMLFRKVGRGSFRPTVHGESFLKSSFNVSKGSTKRAEIEEARDIV